MRFVFRSLGVAVAFIEGGGVYSLDGELVGYADDRQNIYDLMGQFKGLLLPDGRIASDPSAEPPAHLEIFPVIPQRTNRPASVPQTLAMEPLPAPYVESFVVAQDELDQTVAFLNVPLLLMVTFLAMTALAFYLISTVPALTPKLPGITKPTLAAILLFAAFVGIAAGISFRKIRQPKPSSVIVVGSEPWPECELGRRENPIAKVVDRVDAAPMGSLAMVRLIALLKADTVDNILFLNSLRGQMNDMRKHLGMVSINRVDLLSNFIEIHSRRVPLLLLDTYSLQRLRTFSSQSPFSHAAKRLSDIIIASFLLLLQAPLLLLVTLAILISSPGPVFYRQPRIGLAGRIFNILKFRSMRIESEAFDTPQWAMRNDPRITPIGNIIRKTGIDELPQLFSVLRGDMSMVGPSPEWPYFADILREQIPAYDIRNSVRPGVTGWAQIANSFGASLDDARQRQEYDLYYVKHWSVLLDLKILCRTVIVVLLGKGVV